MSSITDSSTNPQGVGPHYSRDSFKISQKKGWEILFQLKEKIQAGMTEADAREVYKHILKQNKIEKNWHPPKIRFGPNSTKSFKEISDESYILKCDDIFFLDIGPIIDGYEVDVGKTFQIGNVNNSYLKIISDGEEIFQITKNKFISEDLKGPDLYLFAESEAKKRGWTMIDEGANGHRVGDFPHHVYYKGSLKGFTEKLVPNLWILEIQLTDANKNFGSFTEDVLGF